MTLGAVAEPHAEDVGDRRRHVQRLRVRLGDPPGLLPRGLHEEGTGVSSCTFEALTLRRVLTPTCQA